MKVFATARLLILAAEARDANIPEDSLLGQTMSANEPDGTDDEKGIDPIGEERQ